ncbi:polysaccharide deacetylase family protein [Rossellomorea marisflavi]|uniref:polysaccharide deacetylase family protein n=2 Tax=Rossellomorea marisflavi TaxID=189381 RepID=UPI003D2EE2D0
MRKWLVMVSMMILIMLPAPADAQQVERSMVEPKGEVIWEVPMPFKKVAITFDDGPHPVYTPQILQILKSYDAKATFFLTGERIERFPDLVKREVKEGHEIGNHSFSHPNFGSLSLRDIEKEISTTEELLLQFQPGIRPKLFRPPGGDLSMPVLGLMKEMDLMPILWSWHQDPKDWSGRSSEAISAHVLENIHNGDIILLHDSGGNRKETVKALETILSALTEKGYQFVTVQELMETDPVFGF